MSIGEGTSRLTGATGSKLGEVAGCHRVRRRCSRYARMVYLSQKRMPLHIDRFLLMLMIFLIL